MRDIRLIKSVRGFSPKLGVNCFFADPAAWKAILRLQKPQGLTVELRQPERRNRKRQLGVAQKLVQSLLEPQRVGHLQ